MYQRLPIEPMPASVTTATEPVIDIKERERRLADEVAWLEYHGLYGSPRNRKERRAQSALLRKMYRDQKRRN